MLRQIAQSPSIIKLEALCGKTNAKTKWKLKLQQLPFYWNYFHQPLCFDKSHEILLES